jgi:hypothetical protein
MTRLFLVALSVLLINLPFGYWRAHVRRFSIQWFLAVHIPVVFVVAMRFGLHLGFAWYTYVVLVSAFFLGQQSGGWVLRRTIHHCGNVSSCLVMDLLRCRARHAA